MGIGLVASYDLLASERPDDLARFELHVVLMPVDRRALADGEGPLREPARSRVNEDMAAVVLQNALLPKVWVTEPATLSRTRSCRVPIVVLAVSGSAAMAAALTLRAANTPLTGRRTRITRSCGAGALGSTGGAGGVFYCLAADFNGIECRRFHIEPPRLEAAKASSALALAARGTQQPRIRMQRRKRQPWPQR